jgi:hypothetical protein
MNNYPNFTKVFIILISIFIIFICAFYNTIREGLTNNNNIVLLGDSIINNSNYVPEGKSVIDILRSKTNPNSVFNFSKDGSTINDLYSQLDKIPLDLNNSDTYIFISSGGNDILNKRGLLNNGEIKQLFDTYMDFIKALRVKLGSAKLNIMNLYLPANPRYQTYKPSIDQWNELINKHSTKVGEMYNVINLDTLIKGPEDFVYDIEPSEIASEKIANIIYLT